MQADRPHANRARFAPHGRLGGDLRAAGRGGAGAGTVSKSSGLAKIRRRTCDSLSRVCFCALFQEVMLELCGYERGAFRSDLSKRDRGIRIGKPCIFQWPVENILLKWPGLGLAPERIKRATTGPEEKCQADYLDRALCQRLEAGKDGILLTAEALARASSAAIPSLGVPVFLRFTFWSITF